MSSELMSLTAVTVFTAVLWMPYILNLIAVRGIMDAVGYPEDPDPLSPWAAKMKAAHANAVENLVVFAALVLIANAAGVSTDATVLACQVYFWARVVHARIRLPFPGCARSLSLSALVARWCWRSHCSRPITGEVYDRCPAR